MAENYSLNSKFGLNVTKQGTKSNQNEINKISLTDKANALFDSFESNISKYDNVFSGEVERQIGMYSRQAMIVGMNLKAADNTRRNFDINI